MDKSLDRKKKEGSPQGSVIGRSFNLTALKEKARTYKSNGQNNSSYRYTFQYDPFEPGPYCTHERDRFRIRGGEDAIPGSIPWLVYVAAFTDIFSSTNCTGVMIGLRWILTAAHCLDITPRPLLFTYFGLYDMGEIDHLASLAMTFPTNYILHPDYNRTTYDADIALVHVRLLGMPDYLVRPACLPLDGDDLDANQSCMTAGWGLLDRHTNRKAQHLQQMELFYQRKEEEKMYFKASPTAGNPTGTCLGDSGAPVMCVIGSQTNYKVTGILSQSPYFCDNRRYPSTYIRIFPYLDWIRDTIDRINSVTD